MEIRVYDHRNTGKANIWEQEMTLEELFTFRDAVITFRVNRLTKDLPEIHVFKRGYMDGIFHV